ncbi:hypothetical protein GCM10027047_03840 [Rhodococcus aerolatus]
MDQDLTPARVVTALWDRLDAADWDGLARLLASDAVVRFAHSGEVFDGPGWVAFNRDYPGRWRADVAELVVDGERVVARARVHDGRGGESHAVASFATVHGGLVTELLEVWAEEVVDPPRR